MDEIPLKTQRRRTLRNNSTFAEIIFWNLVKAKRLGYKFRRQHSIGSFIVDFCCPKLMLIVEIDGMSHDSLERREKDKIRQNFLEQNGYKVIRFTNQQVLKNTESVYNKLNQCINTK